MVLVVQRNRAWSYTEYRQKLWKGLTQLVSTNLKTEHYQINIRSVQSSNTKQSPKQSRLHTGRVTL
jgi:hypothetical protein